MGQRLCTAGSIIESCKSGVNSEWKQQLDLLSGNKQLANYIIMWLFSYLITLLLLLIIIIIVTNYMGHFSN